MVCGCSIPGVRTTASPSPTATCAIILASLEAEWPVNSLPITYFLFPNTIISVGTTGKTGLTVNIHQIFPQSVDHFTSRLSFCAVGGVQSAEHRAEIDRSYHTARQALVNEDYSVTGESHVGLPAFPEGMTLPIGRQEVGVQNFHNNVRRARPGPCVNLRDAPAGSCCPTD